MNIRSGVAIAGNGQQRNAAFPFADRLVAPPEIGESRTSRYVKLLVIRARFQLPRKLAFRLLAAQAQLAGVAEQRVYLGKADRAECAVPAKRFGRQLQEFLTPGFVENPQEVPI